MPSGSIAFAMAQAAQALAATKLDRPTGTADSTHFVRGDGQLAVPPTTTLVETKTETFSVFSPNGVKPLAPGEGKALWIAPWAGTVSTARASNGIGVVGGTLTFDVNKNGTTIFTTQANRPKVLTSDAGGKGQLATPDVTTFVAGDAFTIDMDTISNADATAVDGDGLITNIPSCQVTFQRS